MTTERTTETTPAKPSDATAGEAPAAAAAAEERSPREIREEIEDTREEMGDTVAAVAAKTDVKAQAQARVEEAKGQMRDKAGEAQALAKQNPKPLAIAAGAVGLVLLWRMVRR